MGAGVNYRHISVTVLLTSIILISIWLFSGLSISRYETYKIYTHQSVSGLLIDAPVEYKGVDVGKVKAIELKGSQGIEILLSIKNSVPITKGTIETLTTRGLTTRVFTGFLCITLNDEGKNLQSMVAQPGETYPTIPMTSSTSLSLDTTLLQTNTHLQHITELFQSVFDKENRETLKGLLSSLKNVTNVLEANSEKLNTILTNAEKASYYIEPFLKTGQATMGILEKETLPATHHMFSHLDPFLLSGQTMMLMLETQTLPTANRAISHLDDLSRLLTTLTNEMKQNPSVLFRGTTPPPSGPGETK